MAHIYVNQPFVVQLDTETDLTTATVLKIRYVKPGVSRTTGYLDATQVGTSTVIQTSIDGELNDTLGAWEFRAWITFEAGTNPVPGVPAFQSIEDV